MKRSKLKIQVIILSILSLLVGLSVFVYISSVKSDIESKYNTRSVVVAKKQITAGTSLSSAVGQDAIDEIQFPVSEYPDGALESLDGFSSDLVARFTLQPGQIILRDSFGTQSLQSGSLLIPDGLMAISVSVSENARVGSFLQPGAKVTIYASGSLNPNSEPVTQSLLTGILVLAVGSNTDPLVNQSSDTDKEVITVAVSANQAKRLVHAAQYFSLYFGILGPKVQFDISDPIGNNSLFNN